MFGASNKKDFDKKSKSPACTPLVSGGKRGILQLSKIKEAIGMKQVRRDEILSALKELMKDPEKR